METAKAEESERCDSKQLKLFIQVKYRHWKYITFDKKAKEIYIRSGPDF